MARKRAPGGGRKPSASTPRSQLTVRMPDDLRARLEESAEKRRRTLTQEVLWRLNVSLNRERIDRQDQVMRALCFLFTDLTERLYCQQLTRTTWHRDPFTFQAFKLAVGKLLAALEPPGDVKPPFVRQGDSDQPFHRQLVEWFRTPESAATHAAALTLESLFRPKKITAEDRAVIKKAESEVLEYMSGDLMIDDFEREYFAMDIAGRVLGIDQKHVIGVFGKNKED